jgi:hypothetical protein
MVAHLSWFRANAPGFEHAWLMTTAPQIGIRHTRRLNGVRKMTNADWKAGLRHPDEIGVSPSPGTKFAPVSVPYGAIVSADFDNVFAGGRHVACDPSTQSFMREIPQCWLTGHAAGVGAAVAANRGVQPREVDVGEVRAILRQNVSSRVSSWWRREQESWSSAAQRLVGSVRGPRDGRGRRSGSPTRIS